VATLIDKRDLGQEDAKAQSCKAARPGMKISGKEDSQVMDLVTGWWSEELAEERCWAVISVREGHRVLVHFHNRPAGDYHAVCASLNHQGSGCAWPCLWCETRNMAGGSRLCKDCHRYSCHHSAFTGIHPSILPLTHIPPEQLGEQPEYFTTSVESRRELLQPRRTQQPSTADKAADTKRKKSGLGKAGAPSTCAKRGRVSNNNQEAAPAKRAAQASPLDPIQPIFVHPDVKDVNGRRTLRLPPPARLRTANSLRYSGELGARFGCYLPSKGQGRTYVWAEVNPHLIERGKLKDPEDRAFIKDRCTHILRQDGLIRETSNGFVDTHGCPWVFPEHRGDSTANGEQLHMLECQVSHACDKPYIETLVTSYYNVPVIQWFVISLLQVLHEMNIVCSCQDSSLGPLSHNQAF
jgi:hypothetical protein